MRRSATPSAITPVNHAPLWRVAVNLVVMPFVALEESVDLAHMANGLLITSTVVLTVGIAGLRRAGEARAQD